jgi:hypothetical protein
MFYISKTKRLLLEKMFEFNFYSSSSTTHIFCHAFLGHLYYEYIIRCKNEVLCSEAGSLAAEGLRLGLQSLGSV